MSCDHTRISSSSFSTCLSCKRRAQYIVNEQRERIAELEAVAEKYRELLYQVACKFPNETRHETALRYLKERETPAMTADQCCEAILGGGDE